MKDFRNGEYVESVSYHLNFYKEPGGGFSFPCDENGNIATDSDYYDCWKPNYDRCIELGPEHFPVAFGQVERRVHRWREPNSGVCNCGNRIELHNEYLGACECPHCGQWWNLFGQELKNPSRWNDDGELDYEY